MSTYSEIWQWQLSGFFVGFFGACIFVLPSASMVGNWFVKKRGTIYGIVMACSSISAAVFAQVINAIIMAYGWRCGYLFVGLASFAVVFPCCFLFRYRPSDIGSRPYGDGEVAEEVSAKQKRGVPMKVAVASVSFWCLFLFAGIASFCHGGVEQHIPGYMVQLGLGTAFGAQDSLMSVSLPLLIREIFGNKYYTRIHGWIRADVGTLGTFSGVFVGWVYDVTGTFEPAFAVRIALFLVATLWFTGPRARGRPIF